MKYLITACLLALGSVTAQAQNPGGLDPMTMMKQLQNMSPAEQAAFVKKMQAQATQMSGCISQIDQAKLKALEIKAQQVNNQINSLCAQGNAKEAETYAMREGKKIMNDKTVKHLRN